MAENSPQAVLEPHAAQAWTQLESRVEGVKTKHRVKFFGTGLFFALAIFAAAFLGFSLADILFKLTVGTRVIALLSTFVGVGAVFFWCVIRPWSKLGGSIQVARTVEGKYPQLEEQLSTALEYGQNPELSTKTSSPALVGALMKQTAERAEPLDFARTIRWKPLAMAALAAFVLGSCFALYAAKNRRLFGITFARFLKPTADIPVPTLTEIKNVSPENTEVPVENSVPVSVELDGRMPDTATLSVFIGSEKDGKWEDRVMDRDPADGKYKTTLRRLLDTTKYKIRAGDTESAEYQIDVYKLPEISEFSLRLEHPAYTGKGTETLAPGIGDVRALKGTIVHVDLKANTDLSDANVTFKSGTTPITGSIDANDKRKATLSFKVEKDDEYQLHVSNTKKKTGDGSLFQVKSLKDRPPRVTIKKPEKDLMVHRSQTVNIEISADDDIGVAEIGIFHSLELDETKVMVRRLDPPSLRADGKLVWELGNLGLKGGEVIAYYAYALDADTVTPGGPKIAKSDIHFLTVYDEKEYEDPQSPKKDKKPGTPPAVKQLDKLIDVQKKILKDTFAQAQQRLTTQPAAVTDAEKSAAARTADAQKKLRAQVEELVAKVKQEMESPENADARGADGETPGPDGPKKSGMGEKEIKHMETATEKMTGAEKELKVPDASLAVKPETEALRHLSETRRLLLSDKDGDPRFKMAMDKQSKKKKQQEQDQQQQDQEQAKQEMAEMPKMMEREKQLERELEELSERKKKNPPPPDGKPQTPEQKKEQDEQRRLEREKKDELEQLAKEAEERARKLDQLSQRNPDMQQAADKMQSAKEKLDKAAEEAQKKAEKNTREAQQKAKEAQNDTKDAQRSLRNAMEKQIRQEVANLQKDAQDLAQRQQDLAEQAKQMQNEPQQGQKPDQGQKPEQGQPQAQGKPDQGKEGQPKEGQPQQAGKEGQPKEGQPQSAQGKEGQPKEGQPQTAQGKEGQPKEGQPQSAQGKEGQPKEGQPQSAQGKEGQPKEGQPQTAQGKEGQPTAEQKMRAMAGEQRNIKNDLKDLAERMDKIAQRAQEKGLAGAPELDQAKQQASENSAANQSTQKSQDALQAAKSEEAQREAAKAAKALEQMASTLQQAAQKTTAGDMKELAKAMKKLQGAAKEQSDINKDLAQKGDAPQLGSRQEKVSADAKDLADAAEKLEVLRQNGREGSTKEKLDEAAKQADNAAKAMKSQDAASAKAPAESAEKSLNQALNEMERAAGKTLEDKARDAKAMARAARENQEKAADAAKDIPQSGKPDEKLDPAGQAKRDEAAAKEHQAARDTKRLEHALEGLEEMAKDANPAAADAAKEARETTEQAELPKSMEELAKGIEKIGDPKKAAEDKTSPNVTPRDASKKGEEMAQTIKNVEKNLDAFVAEAQGSQLDRLRAMEQAAREAAKKARELAKENDKQDKTQKPNDQKNDPKDSKNDPSKTASKDPNQKGDPKDQTADATKNDPNAKKNPDDKTKPDENAKPDDKGKPDERAEQIKQLERELKKLQPKLERLEPNAPEMRMMREIVAQAQKGKEASQQKPDPNAPPTAGGKNTGGPAFKRASEQLDEVTGSLVNRIERILRAREVKPDEDEDAPKEYRVLVDKYYRALSEDVEEEKK